MPCTHEQTANVVARARASAGACLAVSISHGPYLAGVTYCDWYGRAGVTATARTRNGPMLLMGQSACSEGEASVSGTEGGGTFNLRGAPYISATATMSGSMGVEAATNSTYSGSYSATATASAEMAVIRVACACDCLCNAGTLAAARLSPYGDLAGEALLDGEWRLLVASDDDGVVGAASLVGTLTANWSVFGEPVGIAGMTGGETGGAASISAGAAVAESYPSIYYSNGLLKLKGVSEIMQNLLPQYMADGEIIKRIIESLGNEIERAIQARSGFPPGAFGLDGVVQQFAVITATWGLDFWEQLLGLPVRTGDTDYVDRRSLILSNLVARRNESEYWFKRRLELLLTTTLNPNPEIFINPGEPAVNPYQIEIESNVMLGEDAPANAMTVALHPSPGVLTGVYTYKATFVFQSGETDEGLSESPSVTATSNRIIVGSIPISTGAAVARKLYRKNGPGNPWYYLTTITDNVTTVFSDNISDASISGNPVISPYNTAVTFMGQKFLDYISKTKPAHLHVDVRSERFRASINKAGDPV